jgi:L-threonylcarbamoyladenylate synthase
VPSQNASFTTRVYPYGKAAIAEAARLILEGLPVAVPTETVYGLAADATSDEAVARIYDAKGRPSFNPLIVHVRDLEQAEMLAELPEAARALARAYWPGALTMVVRRRDGSPVSEAATAGLATVALRCPAHRAMRDLLDACGRPLAAPSANASGGISPTSPDHVLKTLDGKIPLILDDGRTEHGIESTIVGLVGGGISLLRPGPIDFAELAALARLAEAAPSGEIEAPGQLESHYAPSKPLRLDAEKPEPDEWMIGFGAVPGDDTLSASGNLAEAASRLFHALHRAEAQAKPRIAVAPVAREGLGTAINDRLARAAAPRGEGR